MDQNSGGRNDRYRKWDNIDGYQKCKIGLGRIKAKLLIDEGGENEVQPNQILAPPRTFKGISGVTHYGGISTPL